MHFAVAVASRALPWIAAIAQSAPDGPSLWTAGKDDAALVACDQAIAANPQDAGAIELRARCLKNLGRLDEAAAALRTLPRRTMAADLLLAECAAAAKDGTEADEMVARWAAIDPDGIELRLARGRIHLTRRRLAPAIADARFAQSRDPQRFDAQLLLARCAEAAGRPDESLKLLQQLLAAPAGARGADVHLRREATAACASAQIHLQKYDDAIKLLYQLLEECPSVVPWHAQLATVLGLRNRYAESIASWEKAVDLAPRDSELRWRLADMYRSQGRTDDAIAQFEVMLELGQARAVAELRLAELHLERSGEGDLDRARAHIEKALALAPESGDVNETCARIQEKSGDLAAAKASHRKAFASNPLRFDALYRLAMLLARSEDEKELAESEALLERYRRIEPLLVEIKLTKLELDANPGRPVLLTRMAGLLNVAGEYEQARVWAERAAKLDPRSVQTSVQSAYILANLGDLPGARRCFATAIELLESSAPSAPMLATLRDYVGKIDRGEPLPSPLGEMLRPGESEAAGK